MEAVESEIMVSVIMLSYNHEKYITKALESVIAQKTDFSYEILIGDDASTDSSPQILQKYADKYPQIHLIKRKSNVGTTKNAYDLMVSAKGKYLASCESDDYWTDEYKLQKQVDFLESHNEYIGCSHKIMCVDENGNKLPDQKIYWISSKKKYCLRDFKGIYLPGQSSSIVRRNIFLEPRFDYSIIYKAHPFIGDRTTIMLFAAQGNFYKIPEIMSCYRRDINGKKQSLSFKLYNSNPRMVSEELEFEHRLEEYARNVLHVDIGAECYRREMLASAFLKFLRKRDKSSKRDLKNVFMALEYPITGCLMIPFNIFKKIVYKLRK